MNSMLMNIINHRFDEMKRCFFCIPENHALDAWFKSG